MGVNGFIQGVTVPVVMASAAWTHYPLDINNPGWWTTVVPNAAVGQVTAIWARAGAPIKGTVAGAAAGPTFPTVPISAAPVAAFGAFSAVAVLDADWGGDIVHVAYLTAAGTINQFAVAALAGLPVLPPLEIVIVPGAGLGTWPTVTVERIAGVPDNVYIRWDTAAGINDIITVAVVPVGPPQILWVPAPVLPGWQGRGTLTSFYYSWGGFEGTAITSLLGPPPYQIEYAAT